MSALSGQRHKHQHLLVRSVYAAEKPAQVSGQYDGCICQEFNGGAPLRQLSGSTSGTEMYPPSQPDHHTRDTGEDEMKQEGSLYPLTFELGMPHENAGWPNSLRVLTYFATSSMSIIDVANFPVLVRTLRASTTRHLEADFQCARERRLLSTYLARSRFSPMRACQ